MKAIKNKYKCDKGIWNKFNDVQKQMYNIIYDKLSDQDLYLHPKAVVNKKEHWSTTRHNVACVAAWALSDIKIA